MKHNENDCSAQVFFLAGWKLEKHIGEPSAIHIYRESDGVWCGGGIEGDDGAAGLRYEFLDALLSGMQEIPNKLFEMGQSLLGDERSNDHYTADPMFVVQRKRLVAGIDTDYDPEIGWLDEECDLIEGSERDQLETEYQKSLEVPDGYTRTGISWEWEYVDTYLTPQAATARINGGKDGRVYVESACRNHEMRIVREFLKSLARVQTASLRGDGRFD